MAKAKRQKRNLTEEPEVRERERRDPYLTLFTPHSPFNCCEF